MKEMKEQCPVFDVECGYISTCSNIREERCIESLRRAGVEVPPVDATWRDMEDYMMKLIREKRIEYERKER